MTRVNERLGQGNSSSMPLRASRGSVEPTPRVVLTTWLEARVVTHHLSPLISSLAEASFRGLTPQLMWPESREQAFRQGAGSCVQVATFTWD